MKLIITIDLENEAFFPREPDGWKPEAAWLLHDLGTRILLNHQLPIQLRDYNHNSVGVAELETISAPIGD